MGNTSREEARSVVPLLIGVREVAAMLGCSERHVYRLADGGRMPLPMKLGALVRWNRLLIKAWIASGCPSDGSISPIQWDQIVEGPADREVRK